MFVKNAHVLLAGGLLERIDAVQLTQVVDVEAFVALEQRIVQVVRVLELAGQLAARVGLVLQSGRSLANRDQVLDELVLFVLAHLAHALLADVRLGRVAVGRQGAHRMLARAVVLGAERLERVVLVVDFVVAAESFTEYLTTIDNSSTCHIINNT